MKRNRFTILVILFSAISLVLVGCGSQQISNQVKVESGVIDEGYVGIVCPEVPRDYKIIEESKKGMIVVTIKCGVQKEIPGDLEEGDSSDAKPKI